jgi:hypothetical protein
MQGNQSIEKKLKNVIMAVISGVTTTQFFQPIACHFDVHNS